MSKEFGLIMPTKNKMIVQAPGKRAAIFDEESDSDEPVSVKPKFFKPLEKKHVKLAQDKAIEEDPTVFQYDEIYDDMDKKRKESKLSNKNIEKKPKYISNLLKTAERRKRENERRIERQVQKEREAEGDEFKDKESYVTPSYQKKLEEMKALEEKEKREEYLESIGDVRKQGNLDGFYRHLYDQKIKYEDEIKKEIQDDDQSNMVENKIEDTNSLEDQEKLNDNNVKKISKKRQYRRREDSNSDKDSLEESKKQHIPSNLDADSDFSIDSSDSDNEDVQKKKETQCENLSMKDPEKDIKVEETMMGKENKATDVILEQVDNNEHEEKKPIEIIEPLVKKPKIDIWKKRTVGEVFEAARKRYFERLALRESG